MITKLTLVLNKDFALMENYDSNLSFSHNVELCTTKNYSIFKTNALLKASNKTIKTDNNVANYQF